MLFTKVIGLQKLPLNAKIKTRIAVRAVIFLENKNLLMVHTSDGDYKFPGGGVKKSETHLSALKREVLEETGIIIEDDIALLAIIKEQHRDVFKKEAFFVMESKYYTCTAKQLTDFRNFDEYEKKLSFQTVEIHPKEAYNQNLNILNAKEKNISWLEREIALLEFLLSNVVLF